MVSIDNRNSLFEHSYIAIIKVVDIKCVQYSSLFQDTL